MSRNTAVVSCLAVMIVIIVTVDVLFFKDRFVARLLVNLAIVVVFLVCYWLFLREA